MEEAGMAGLLGGQCVKYLAQVGGRETGLAFGRGKMQAEEDWFLT